MTNKKRVIIIHGYRSYPDDCWFPWLKNELQKKGFEVHVPRLKKTKKPEMRTWVNDIQKAVGKPESPTILVGHSLGTIAILRYIESLPPKSKIEGSIFVAGRVLGRKTFGGRYGTIKSFFEKPLNWKKIKNHCNKFIGVYSIDDPIVSTENGRLLQSKLGAKLVLEKNKGHFSREDMVFKLPIVLREILDI